MKNETFYVAAATVIPLLLIAVMATRSLRAGEFASQPRVTLLIFGLPVLAELAAFAYLFSQPVPTAAAVILAVVTWAGLVSQLALAAWWCAELIRRADGQRAAPSNGDLPEARADGPRLFCPTCGIAVSEGSLFCRAGHRLQASHASGGHQPRPVLTPPAEHEKSLRADLDGGEQEQQPGADRVEPMKETRTSVQQPAVPDGNQADRASPPPAESHMPIRPGPEQLGWGQVRATCPLCGAPLPAGSSRCPFCGR